MCRLGKCTAPGDEVDATSLIRVTELQGDIPNRSRGDRQSLKSQ